MKKMQYMTEFLVHFIDKNGNQNSDTCRAFGANGYLVGNYESARAHGEYVLGQSLKTSEQTIIGYKIYQLTI